MPPRLSWLGFLTLAGAAAAGETVHACLSNLGPQQLDEVCGSDGVRYDSYAHALCHNAVDAGWRRGACERRSLNEDFEGPQEEHHDHPSHPYLSLAFIGGGLLLGILTQLALHRWLPSFPFALAVFLEGMALQAITKGQDGDFARSLRSWSFIDPHLLLFTFLPILLFGDAMAIDAHLLAQKAPHVLLLAGPGVLMGAFATAAFAKWCLPYDWSFAFSMLLGSILAATDPVAVVALLKDLGASPALTMVIMGESLLNDGTAASLFLIILEDVEGHDLTAKFVFKRFAELAIAGPLIGYAFGLATVFVLLSAGHRWSEVDTTLQLATTVVSAYMSFFVAERTCDSSGILACVFDALVLARYAPPLWTNADTIREVWETFGWIANTLIFELAGLIVMRFLNHSELSFAAQIRWSLAIYAACLVIRYAVVFLLWPLITYIGERTPKEETSAQPLGVREAVVVGWSGLRGAVGLALAIVVYEDLEGPEWGERHFDGNSERAKNATILVFHVAMMAALTLAINAPTTMPLLKYLGLAKTDSKTLALRGFVFDEVGTTCRAVFDHLRAEQDEGDNCAFDVAEVVRLCSVLRYRDDAPHEVVAASLSIQDTTTTTTMRRSTSLTRATLAQPPNENDLIVVGREVFMHAVQAEYWNQIRSGILPEGSPVASWLLASCGLALDNSAAPLHSFEFLVDKCHAEHSPRKKSGFRSWLWKHAPDAVAALVRLVVGHRIGYGRKQETFLLVTSFRLAHETAVDTVAAYFRDRAQSCVCRAEEAEEVSRTLERECKAELHRANKVRCAIDPAVRKKMRTLYVAQTILSIQRDAVCSLASRGLVSTKEKEVLLEEVLEDLEEVFKLEEGRSHEQAHGGEHGGVEHWVDGDHTIPSHDVEAHFSSRPAPDASRLALANSRMFGTNGAYASVRARIGDTRRILDLRTSGEAAEWCGAHIASTRRRMDRASTVAPSSRASTVETIETQDSTTEAH